MDYKPKDQAERYAFVRKAAAKFDYHLLGRADRGCVRAYIDDLAARHRFHHWELAFADVFATNGGFDLVLGNPPWVKVEWEEGGVLGDRNPLFVLRKHSATEITALRDEGSGPTSPHYNRGKQYRPLTV